jgi:hypothetical protein
VQSILLRAPNLSQLERVLDEDLTVYCKSNTSSNLRSPPVDPILAFKFDGSSNLSEKPSHDNLDAFVKDNFIVKLRLDQKLFKQLDPQEVRSQSDFLKPPTSLAQLRCGDAGQILTHTEG